MKLEEIFNGFTIVDADGKLHRNKRPSELKKPFIFVTYITDFGVIQPIISDAFREEIKGFDVSIQITVSPEFKEQHENIRFITLYETFSWYTLYDRNTGLFISEGYWN